MPFHSVELTSRAKSMKPMISPELLTSYGSSGAVELQGFLPDSFNDWKIHANYL